MPRVGTVSYTHLDVYKRQGQLHFIITTTTDTGFARGQELYGSQPDVTLVRFPLDFSWAVNRLLENLRPSVAVLMELEVWPNFLRQCRLAGIPVLIINGRLTEASFSRYARIKPMARTMFRQLQGICAQDEICLLYTSLIGALCHHRRRLHVRPHSQDAVFHDRANLGQSLVLNLPHALLGHSDDLADLFQGQRRFLGLLPRCV